MIIKFTQFFGDDKQSFAYFERKWGLVKTLGPTSVYELSLESLAAINGNAAPIVFEGAAALPKHDDSHKKIGSAIADKAMPLLDDETLLEPDTFDVLAQDIPGVRKGTLLLRRKTNYAEVLYFYPCTNVLNGYLYRLEADDKAHEKILATLERGPQLQLSEAELGTNNTTSFVPITMSAIAANILLGIVSGVILNTGTKAIDWAFRKLGIHNPLDHADLTYDQLVIALRLQSRADFRKQIRIRFNAFQRLREDFNGGMRTEEKLNELYHEIRKLTSWLEADERSPDRVHLLALAQSMYLATMQEAAEWFRKTDPEKMKSFYQSLVQRAKLEMNVLAAIQAEAYQQRLDKITGIHDSFDFTLQDARIVFFEDAAPEDNDARANWERAYYNCTDRNHQTMACRKWEYTSKGKAKVNEVTTRMEQHRTRIKKHLDKALDGIPQTIARFDQISKMRIPPDEPK